MLCIMLANTRRQRNILYVGLRNIVRDAISVSRGRYSCMIGNVILTSSVGPPVVRTPTCAQLQTGNLAIVRGHHDHESEKWNEL
jgi:hypothetical protein